MLTEMKRQKSRSSVKGGSWVRIMRDELQQMGLGNGWLEGEGRCVWQIINTRCNNTDRRRCMKDVRENGS